MPPGMAHTFRGMVLYDDVQLETSIIGLVGIPFQRVT